MTQRSGPLMLLDAAGLYFRAFHGVPTSITAPDGTPVNAVRGFVDMVATLVRTRRPATVVACLDADWRPAWRVALLPSYKAHRLTADGAEDSPDELTPQVPVILDVLAAAGIAAVGAAGYEADDVIGTLATRATVPVEIVTGDRDLFQLVDDARQVRVLYIGRGVAHLEVLDDAAVRARYGVRAAAYADLAALRGDPSDGLPGVAGIGEKGAAALLTAYPSLEALLAAVDDPRSGLTPAQRRKLTAGRDYLAVAPEVVRVALDIDMPEPAAPPADPAALTALGDRHGITSSVERLTAALGLRGVDAG